MYLQAVPAMVIQTGTGTVLSPAVMDAFDKLKMVEVGTMAGQLLFIISQFTKDLTFSSLWSNSVVLGVALK